MCICFISKNYSVDFEEMLYLCGSTPSSSVILILIVLCYILDG
jgi:hypothetical protein